MIPTDYSYRLCFLESLRKSVGFSAWHHLMPNLLQDISSTLEAKGTIWLTPGPARIWVQNENGYFVVQGVLLLDIREPNETLHVSKAKYLFL
jgi:hypothetical protein